jgi:biotin carboxyl carrier protein
MSAKKIKTAKTVKKVVDNPCDSPGMECQSLIIEGSNYKTQLTKKYLNRKIWKAPDSKKLYSYIPGTILKIMVSEGQTISELDEVIILEAMKMRNRITIPVSGVIKKIYIKEGERIPKGELMLELE